MRLLAYLALGTILAFNAIGFAFLLFCWFIDVSVHVEGGMATLVTGIVVSGLCVMGMNRLRGKQAAGAVL